MLLGGLLSDTVILNSPTTTERDHLVVEYLERVLRLRAADFGREMFEATTDVSALTAEEIISRDAKEYDVGGGQEICIAQIEVVGTGLLERKSELLDAIRRQRDRKGYRLYALMITDVLDKGTSLLISGEIPRVSRAFDVKPHDSVIDLPGVMSRKKQVAPKLLASF
jgi:manganese-dependent inorganic pyrophosphatase